MDRTIMSAGVLLASLLVAMPALAQDFAWTTDRPDGHAPAGVKADFILPAGQIYFGYRYFQDSFEGTLFFTDPVTSADVLDQGFIVATPSYERTIHELDVRLGLTDFLTVQGSVPFYRNTMIKETSTTFFETSSDVVGDVSIRGLFRLLEMDEHRLHLTLGATVPIGTLGERGPTASSTSAVLPFTMQGGSGSPDFLLGGTYQVQNDVASVGAQVNTVLRFLDNKQNYRLGNRYDFSVWGAYKVSDWASFSLRGLFEHFNDISGSDARTNRVEDPLAEPFFQGGERVVIPFGFNLYLRDGAAAGHRLLIEYYYTVHEDLNGFQPSSRRTLVVSWQTLLF